MVRGLESDGMGKVCAPIQRGAQEPAGRSQGRGKKGEKKKGKGKGRKMMNDNVAQLATGSKSFKSKMNGMQAIVNSVEQAKHVAFEQTKLQYADSTRTDGGGKAISS